MSIRIEVFKEQATLPYIRILSEMRVKAFRHFPYLYVGNIEDDFSYTKGYSMPQGLLIVAFKDETIVGIYSAMPMSTPIAFLQELSQKFSEEGVTISKCFYAGELIINPPFQKQGIGSQLMKRLLQEVKEMGFETMIGVTSIRPLNHPLRPQGYFDTDEIWGKYGFKKSSVVFSATWPTQQEDGTVKEEMNELACWVNSLK